MGIRSRNSSLLRSGLSAVGMLTVAACAATTNQSLVAPSGNGAEPTAASFSATRIKADIGFLADDMLKGRDTGSEGHRIAANYVAAQFERLGLKPAGVNGSYFQEVPFKTAVLEQDAAEISITVGGKESTLVLGDDYFMSANVKTPKAEISGDVVFVGYGVHAPSIGIDDLKGMDLEGKIVLYVSGVPSGLHSEIAAHLGSSSSRPAEFARRGAIGTMRVNTPEADKERPVSTFKRFLGGKRFDWVEPEGATTKRVKVGAIISNDAARTLFEGADISFDDALKNVIEDKFTSVALKSSVTMKRSSSLTEAIYSPNVLAVLEGSDPTLKAEYVVLSAHLDHIGISTRAKDGEDKINNGALDNATGISVMLEVARAYADTDTRPRRSILFAAVTAEEKGLLGAGYFAEYPTVEQSAMVADVNLDMPLLLYNFTDVVAFGAERSSLGPITREAIAKIGVTLSPDPMPQQNIFVRSDHYQFVKKGIPAVFLMTGWGKGVNGKDAAAIWGKFFQETYHKPSDQTDLDIDYEVGAKFAHVNWLITNAIANADERPTWNEGDFFGETFAGK